MTTSADSYMHRYPTGGRLLLESLRQRQSRHRYHGLSTDWLTASYALNLSSLDGMLLRPSLGCRLAVPGMSLGLMLLLP